MAAFALARMQFRGKSIILAVIIATLIVPFETMALPLLWWVNKLPDGFDATAVSVRAGSTPTRCRSSRSSRTPSRSSSSTSTSIRIPKELDEAAVVDGAGWFRIYRSIVMPLSGPAIATVAILTFLPAWNSYLWPLMVVQTEDLRPVMVGIDYFQQLNVLLGPAHGLRHHDHHPGPRAVHRLPTLLRQSHRLVRRQGIIRFSGPNVLTFPGWCCRSGGDTEPSPTRIVGAGFDCWPFDRPRVTAPGT